MHPNPAFRGEARTRNLAFARERGFGVLAVGSEGPPLMSHIPFVLNENGTEAKLHLVRSNPISRACTGALPARIAVNGPDGYISPDWYGVEDQVPTWNYVAVHLTGVLEPLPQDTLRDVIDRETDFFEERLAPKLPWRSAKMTKDVLERMMRMIQPFRLSVEQIDGTWKLGQNKPIGVRHRAAKAAAHGIGNELVQLSTLMLDVDSVGEAS